MGRMREGDESQRGRRACTTHIRWDVRSENGSCQLESAPSARCEPYQMETLIFPRSDAVM